jgi:micrococcal nuclease
VRTVLAAALAVCACSTGQGSTCGPTEATVAEVIDGDTVELSSGERVRYLLVDTPELATDCYGQEAKRLNEDLVLHKRVSLTYDVECQDRFGRLLAYVSVGDRDINRILVERGYACTLYIPPDGEAHRDEFVALEATAKEQRRGMWGACQEIKCD